VVVSVAERDARVADGYRVIVPDVIADGESPTPDGGDRSIRPRAERVNAIPR